ncbi:hypothetical protein A2V49_02280 [candidate division WWE3 bacterium RBG_19FT_COMBO_34_6]|uniref:Glycosyl transferase family 1 domain-containing protein n=1 Tax=candidate division WWE3 bacterium RBG_19FT_COMBO_34_6 TaxID=1802612 RepID=A0A1F4UJF5_UNCKA|nr:MAG: hypothetical protein A2V49_02280 [candidate division WWE3 bacterium RBG_19FT_COMBO_34_6]
MYKKIKIVMITSLQPYSNYSRFLCQNIDKNKVDLIVYSENNKKNLKIENCGNIKLLLDRSIFIYFRIIKELLNDKPDIVHLQYELNMYGGIFVNLIFPFFLIILKILRFKVLVTMHSVVDGKIINKDFVKLFRGDNSKIPASLLKIYFYYSHFFIAKISNLVIVHTNILKNILSNEYSISKKKIFVIHMGVPIMFDKYKNNNKNYFFYFGYIVRRKGLENMILGFKKFLDKSKNNKRFKLLLSGGVIKGQEFAKTEFQNLIKKINVKNNVKLLGFLDKDEIHEYCRNAYSCVMPAVITISASGPLSMVFGHGKLCIASKVGNFKEEIIHMHDGYLIANNKWDKAFEYVANNKKFVIKAEKNVKIKALERSWANAACKNIKIYEKLL